MTSIPLTRPADPGDAATVAKLLHAFNTEFDTASPGIDVLAHRLTVLLAQPMTFAILGGSPAVGVALVTLRANVWSDGPIALLDEMYVAPAHRRTGIGSKILEHVVGTCRERGVSEIEINVDESDADAMRFYESHGFTNGDPETGEKAYYFVRSL